MSSQLQSATLPRTEYKAPTFALMMLTIVYAFNYVDRQILVVLQEQIKIDMGLSDTQLGLLSGFSFAIFYVTAGIPIAYWADRGNRKNIISLALALWSAMTALSGLAQNYLQLLLARIGVGLGEAGGSPPAHSMISDYYPEEKRGTALSIYSSGLYLGVLVGYILGGALADAIGWRATFYVMGIPGVLFALAFYFLVKEPQRGRFDSPASNKYKPTLKETLKTLANYRSFVFLTLGCGMIYFAGIGTSNFAASLYLRNHGLSLTEVGIMLAIAAGLSGMIGTFLGGVLGDKLGSRDKRWYLWVPALGSLISIPTGIIFFLADNTAVAITFQFLSTVFFSVTLAPCLAVSHALVHPAMRALTSAILLFSLNLIGLGLGPVSTGLISDSLEASYGIDSLRYAMVVVSLIGSVAIVFYFLAARYLNDDLTNRIWDEHSSTAQT